MFEKHNIKIVATMYVYVYVWEAESGRGETEKVISAKMYYLQ